MTDKILRIARLKVRTHFQHVIVRRTWLPSIGSLVLALALVVALSPAVPSPPGKNVLVGPGGTRLHIQRTSDALSSFTPYTPGELWGGGNMVEDCLACDLQAASGKVAGQSIQSGQQVNPATGDFTYSLPLFTVPATGGTSLGLDLQYDSQEAGYNIACSIGGCPPRPTSWPDFGNGWRADDFPTEATWNDGPGGVGGTTWIEVSEPNGSQVTFQAMGTATTCPSGDYSNYLNYTIPSGVYGQGTNQQNFCAPYRVNAQVGQFSSTFTDLYSQDGKSTDTFYVDTSTPEESGNVGNQDLLTYNNHLETAGVGTCPPTATEGIVSGCWTVTDGTRTLTLVAGTPYDNADDGGAVLAVIDPLRTQDYVIEWEPSASETLDEPSYIGQVVDSSVGDQFLWQDDGTLGEDSMTLILPGNPASGGEAIEYTGDGQFVSSTTDDARANTTSYSYANAVGGTGCGLCLGIGQNETTTVTYPYTDGEVDVDNYTAGILESNSYGTGSNLQTVSYSVSYPTVQDNPIIETFTGPAAGQVTAASTNGINITLLTDAETNLFTSMYAPVTLADPASTFDELCWTAPGNYSSNVCGSPPSGIATEYVYDANGDVTSAADPIGNTTRYGYNDDLMICWVAPPTVTSSGSACGDPTANPTEAPTGASAYQYDDQGDLSCQFVAYGLSSQAETKAEYDVDGEMTHYYPPDASGYDSDTCSHAIPHTSYGTTYAYTNGELTTETAPNSQVTTNTYTAGLLEKQKNSTGITTNAYDGDGRLCWTARASLTASVGSAPYSCGSTGVGSETSYSYLADTSTQATVKDPAGNTSTYSYTDNAYPSSPTEIADPENSSIVYDTYDANGNLCDSGVVVTTSCISQAGDTAYTYDTLGEDVATMEDPSGNTTTYGHTNTSFPKLVTSEKDATGANTWIYAYDADGRLYQSTDPSGNVVTTGYDADSRKCYQEVGSDTAYTCASLPTGIGDSNWIYDANGTLQFMEDNLGTSQEEGSIYSEDAAGNYVDVDDDNGNQVTYAYNASGQVSCIGYPAASHTASDCSAAPSATNPIVDYNYSAKNLLSSTADWLGNTTTYGYSANGLNDLTSITYPTTSADKVTYGYDADSQVNSQYYSGTPLSSVPDQSWGYNADSLVDSATQLDAPGSSYTSSPTYDSSQDHNWVASNTNPGASGADAYAYNANGELASDAPPSGSATSYDYNTDDELCWSLSGTSSNSCLSPPTGATTYTYTPDGQRCWSAPSNISTASCGSPPSSGATGYAWNSYGELCWSGPIGSTKPSCASPPTSGVTEYSYDGNGDRMTETSPAGATEEFTWGDSGSTPLLLQDGTNTYIYGPALFGGTAPVEQINISTGVARYLTSAPSGVQLVLNQDGSMANESSYSTYGTQYNSSSAATPFGFEGGYTDPDKLIFLIHRYYDPATDQFISVDPDVSMTVQPYSYSGDNPLNASDPLGDMTAQAFFQWLEGQPKSVQQWFHCAAAYGINNCSAFLVEGPPTVANCHCTIPLAGITGRGLQKLLCAGMAVLSMELCLQKTMFQADDPLSNRNNVHQNAPEDEYGMPGDPAEDYNVAKESWLQELEDDLKTADGDAVG